MPSITGITPEGTEEMNARPASNRPIEALPRHERASSLLARARTLRAQARRVNPVLADAYLRRAAELSLEAWARAIHDEPGGPRGDDFRPTDGSLSIETFQAAVAAA
jgi:hypothetical protein